MNRIAFQQVDVFTSVPFQGNPVAVVLEGDRLTAAQMQSIAAWTNLSETTFVCTPTHAQADYRLRIFTPKSELNFGGHPTIGSAYALLRHGLQPRSAGRLVQECGRGLVQLRVEGERLFLALPEPSLTALDDALVNSILSALGLAAGSARTWAKVDVGVAWITLQLDDDDAVRALRPDFARLRDVTPAGAAGVTVFGLTDHDRFRLEVRSFAPAQGIPEDPVCGSGNGCVAALIRAHRLLTHSSYVAAQGACVGRDGRVEVRYEDSAIWLGGNAVTCIEGWLQVGTAATRQGQ